MSIENGAQVLPTEGFDDFAEETKAEEAEYENQINDDQELNNENTAQLEADDPNDDGEAVDNNSSDDSNDDDNTEIGTEDANKETETEVSEATEEDAAETDANSESETKAQNAQEEFTKKEKFERYSRSVQRRINKEIKQREQLRAENDDLRNRLDGIESRMHQDSVESESSVLANRLRNATAIKQQLMEDGEYEQVTKVDNDIIQMRIHQNRIDEAAQANQPQQQQQQQQQQFDPQYPNQQYQQQPQQQEAPHVPDLQTKWIQGNERFGKDVAYTNYVNTTYDALIDEGYDPETEGLYEELNTRTGAPKTEVVAATKPVVKSKPKQRPQSAPTPNVNQAQKPSASKQGITEADKINMRNWGLDPTKKEVRQEWLNNKRGKK